MATYFFDTSGLAKRYIVEQGSQWAKQILRPSADHQILVAASARVEMLSLMSRQQRMKSISPTDFYRIRGTFSIHLRRQYRVIPLNDAVLARAARLVQNYPLKSLDAIQLASALEARKILRIIPIFVTADRQLLAAAQAEGFPTDDPNLHP
ncbi:MAG: type II toxin-antitoxin system VapC family toxin [Anaerolineae bacterium]|nr:type II toxin-antitoxin system VapC family toxin [Anaerolineae bacterium]